MRLLPYGDRALLAEFPTQEGVLGALVAWRDAPPGVLELVPAARTVLVRIDPGALGLGHLKHWLRSTPRIDASLPVADSVTIPVRYDGQDLAAVAQAWQCSPDDVIERHRAREWVCVFVGFAPGFPYLVPVDGESSLPPVARRATSRTAVPAGAVALAAEYCGIYPRSSPGGWQLIGTTDAVLWDADRAGPALVTPGTRVRFSRAVP
ncbi:MAG: allophanate hydrolase subunit 1 [Microcella sp.]|uniref:5-oxoprolinase subunit B family protein n=1 Tax=Microcella sp. TaxID=1913979 RepID=UPI0033162036